MHNFKKNNYVLFGNPVAHSKSPFIHNFFSKQIGIVYNYQSIKVPIFDFSDTVSNFFKYDGVGANVTAPFKEQAYLLSDQLTDCAKISQSVNTLKKINHNTLLGDNTDGIGLLSDLIRLNFIKKNFSILILGAGGAVRGILFHLLTFGCSVYILNRTFLNAKKLVLQFNQFGNIKVFDDSIIKKKFDLIINAISRNNNIKKDFFPVSLVSSKTFFYDMNYHVSNTVFINWCIEIGANYVADGIGMLILQAAHSCFFWHGILPEISPLIQQLEKKCFL
ncbi:Shikimate dehydrogenase (NADP(+)) [Buchnera aphidicola (Cavariella theobaldi)]